MENRHPKKQVNTLGKQIRRSASNIFQKWRKEPTTSGINNIVYLFPNQQPAVVSICCFAMSYSILHLTHFVVYKHK